MTDYRYPSKSSLTPLATWDRDLASNFHPGEKVNVRLLYRSDMIELYLEDYLMVVYSFVNATGSISTGDIALYNAAGGTGAFSRTSRFSLNLS